MFVGRVSSLVLGFTRARGPRPAVPRDNLRKADRKDLDQLKAVLGLR
jgi:hypothetical protein